MNRNVGSRILHGVGPLTRALIVHAESKGLFVDITNTPVKNPMTGGTVAYWGDGTASVYGSWCDDKHASALVAHELGHYLLAQEAGRSSELNYGLSNMQRSKADAIEDHVGNRQLREYCAALGRDATLSAFRDWPRYQREGGGVEVALDKAMEMAKTAPEALREPARGLGMER